MASVSGKWKAPRLADDARLEIQQGEQTSCCALGMMCYPPPAPGTLKNESRKWSERGDLSFRPPTPQGGNCRFSSPFRSLPVLPVLGFRGSGRDPWEAWPFPGCNFGCKFPQSCRFPRPLAVGELDASLLYFLIARQGLPAQKICQDLC
jgi:hypothetical protein